MDLEFRTIRTPAIVKWIYPLGIWGLLFLWVASGVVGWQFGAVWAAVGALFVGPAIFIAGILGLRVGCELLLMVVRMSDDLHAIRTAMSAERTTPSLRPDR